VAATIVIVLALNMTGSCKVPRALLRITMTHRMGVVVCLAVVVAMALACVWVCKLLAAVVRQNAMARCAAG